MAWIRTSTSLIAFGFTIFKFSNTSRDDHRRAVVSPWAIGMAMIFVGLTGLALAWVSTVSS